MNEIEKLLAKRNQISADMQKLLDVATLESRNLTGDEGEKYDSLDREFDEMSLMIKRLEKQQKRERELDNLQTPPLVAGKRSKKLENIEMDDEEVREYSILKVIRALESGNYSSAEYELEYSRKIAEKVGISPRGFYIPMQVQRAILSTGNSGALVGTTHRDDMYIEALRAESIVMGMGAVMLTDLVGNVDIPKAMGGMSFSFIAEDDDSPDTDASFESVTLTPRTVSGSIAITRKLTKQSSPEIERLIESDMRAGMALMIDKAVLAGDGTGANPTGILHTTGVNTVAIADADGKPTFAETVAFETALAEDNALRGTLNYVTTPAINGHWKTAPIDAGSGVMINKNNIVNGYKSTGTTLMPTGKTIFGNFSDVIIGTWGILDLVLDTATRAAKGGIVLRAWHEIDVAIRHPQSFAVSA